MKRAVFIAKHGHTQAHFFYRSLDSGYAHHIADVVLVFQQNKKSIDEIMHQGLRAEANRQAGNARAGQHRSQVQSQQGEDFQRRDKQDNEQSHAGNHAGDGPELLDAHSRR